MEKKNVSFSKDGMKVGVKEMSEEEYANKAQRCVISLHSNTQFLSRTSIARCREDVFRTCVC
jgi:hypothetical protein